MKIVVPHRVGMVPQTGLLGEAAKQVSGEQILINDDLTEQERRNVALVDAYWDCWTTVPFDLKALGKFLAPNVTVRSGWRGEHVISGRDEVLGAFAYEVKRQIAHEEVTEVTFPVVVAKGPIIFHTWVWTARSERDNYHIERPMAAFYLITDGLIERWDSYCTGSESEPGYVGGNGPDGL